MKRDTRQPRTFLWTVMALLGVYAGLRFVLPWLAVAMGVSETPAPVPRFALGIYMLCAAVGALVYVTSDERRLERFLGPVQRIFVVRSGKLQRRQLLILIVLPLAAGLITWRRISPSSTTPAVLRVQHPTLSVQYSERENPFTDVADEELRAGTVLYQKNCRPCHGTAASGDGPLARGLRLRPVDFTDPGTIATVVEVYPFWRISAGGTGLPPIATPWNSAMPAWADELDEADIWRIIMAEYRIAGREPRIPEGLE
ncbi:MAG: c-type cytochrome [Gemmatimonadales bacterium]